MGGGVGGGVGLAVSVGKKALMCIVVLNVKGTSTDISKTVFRKVLFMLSSMPSFSFIGYILTELFRKPDNCRQIYKQTSSTFSTSNDLSKRKHYQYVITRLRYSSLITLKKKYRSSHQKCRRSHQRCSIKKCVLKDFANFTGKHLCWSLF